MNLTSVGDKCFRLSGTLFIILTLSHCAQFSAVSPAPATAEMPAADEPQTQPQPEQTQQSMSTAQARPVLTPELLKQFQQAKQLMRAADYPAALRLLEPLALAVPEAAGIGYNLALCYWQLQQTEQARLQLTAVLQRQPDYVEAANLLGVIARQQGNFSQARRYWLDALVQRGDFASAHKNLGFLYELYLAQPEQARYHYQQYQQLTGDPMAEAWLNLLEQSKE